MKCTISPIRGLDPESRPWEGDCKKKPWDYRVTAVIPCLDTYDTLNICIELLRLQTERPYVIIIDTGSCDEEFEKISALRNDDLEVHSLRFNAVKHPSDFPAMAMDLAFSICRSTFLFATHSDCFLKRRDFLEDLLDKCKKIAPVVGYEISPRPHKDWKGMISHTASMYHMPTMDKIGFGWSLRRLCNLYDIQDYKPDPLRPAWPDTELLGNYILRKNKIKTHIIGTERNFERNVDDNIDHCRSITSGRLYSQDYAKTANEWAKLAKNEAIERMERWRNEIINHI